MNLYESGFQFTSSDEHGTARDALDDHVQRLQKIGELVPPQVVMLRTMLDRTAVIANFVPTMGSQLYAGFLLGALSSYVESEIMIPPSVDKTDMSDADKLAQNWELQQHEVAKTMIAGIEVHLGIPEFNAWLDTISPSDFATFDREV